MSRRLRSDYRLSLGWILGVTFMGTLTRLKLPQWSSLSFGAAVCLRLPPHTTSRRKLSRLATDQSTCSCLRLTVATNSPRKGLSPPIQCPCRAHPNRAVLVTLGVALTRKSRCHLTDIMVVLEETQTSPEYFPQLESRDDMAAAMVADGETLNPLNVEVFGGGTWITGLSFLTGLSAMDFGWRNPYLTMTLQDSVKGALPQILADCGYHTMAILSLDYHFVNEGPFLSSIGFETVLDRLDIEAPKRHMRDNFYFETALKEIRKHRLEDDRPLFLYVQTMFGKHPA